MLVPLSWLNDYVDINVSADELEKKLFDCGFEVEEKWQVGKDISGIVVGYVESCEPIPETHLHVCQVNVGGPELLQICCGADNVKAGGKFPVAMVGAQVYATAKDHVTIEGVATIKKGKLRGYESYGMLCSGTELGLNEDLYPGAGYNGLLVLPGDAQIGSDVKELTGLNDWIFDVSITANRPDCQSIFGLAREVAAALGQMVSNLTIGKKKYADVEEEVQELIGKLQALQNEFLDLADQDARVFAPLAAAISAGAYSTPQSSLSRRQMLSFNSCVPEAAV